MPSHEAELPLASLLCIIKGEHNEQDPMVAVINKGGTSLGWGDILGSL